MMVLLFNTERQSDMAPVTLENRFKSDTDSTLQEAILRSQKLSVICPIAFLIRFEI